jgi:hypothetical protein
MKKSNRFGSRQAWQALMLPLIGMLLLLGMLGNPRVEALHGSDVLKLVACGFLLGVGLASLLAWLKPGSFDSSTKDQS